jgi:VCBS repeat-containing protein
LQKEVGFLHARHQDTPGMAKDSGLFSVALAGHWAYDAGNTRHLVQLGCNTYPVYSIV